MRHRISGRKLNRKTSHRISLLKNLAKSLIVNEQIETTLPKAKDLRPFVEKILHSGKSNSLHSRRKVFSYLRDDLIVNKVFDVLAKRYANRNGGYTRVLKSGFRYGDAAPKAIIELVDRDVNAKGLIDKKRNEELKKNVESEKQELNKDQKVDGAKNTSLPPSKDDLKNKSLKSKAKDADIKSSKKTSDDKKEEGKNKKSV